MVGHFCLERGVFLEIKSATGNNAKQEILLNVNYGLSCMF